MHFDKIYLEDNFVPDIISDQFRRKKIGVSICIKEGESMDDAMSVAETFIKEYIQKNTVVPDHQHIEERIIPEHLLPVVQVQKSYGETLEEQINSCTDIGVLESYKFIAKKDKGLQLAYDRRMNVLKTFKKIK